MEQCVPTVPQWRLASLPRYLEASDVERVVNSCNLTTGHGLRDHAILLLLSRLGLRASDVVWATLNDFDWHHGTLHVRGKGRREVLLPLPQDVGDAVRAYIDRGRPKSASERVFLTVYAPTRPFASSATVSSVVSFALTRAHISDPPSRGAHLLRHSAATAMLRSGGSLDTIQAVLRHQSSESTAVAGGYIMLSIVVERHIALHHATGYLFRKQSILLRNYARFAEARGEDVVIAASVLEWAAKGPSAGTRRGRLEVVRRFARLMHAEAPRHEVPPAGTFGLQPLLGCIYGATSAPSRRRGRGFAQSRRPKRRWLRVRLRMDKISMGLPTTRGVARCGGAKPPSTK